MHATGQVDVETGGRDNDVVAQVLQRKVDISMRMRPGTCAKSRRVMRTIPRGHGSADCRCRVSGDALAEARGEPVVPAAYISM